MPKCVFLCALAYVNTSLQKVKGHSIRAHKTPRFERVLYNLHSSVANARYTSAQNAAFKTLARNAE
jgi:hypothetical protein